MKPTPKQWAEAERLCGGPSTWTRRCQPLQPCESELCGRQACVGLSRAHKALQARARYAYKTRSKR